MRRLDVLLALMVVLIATGCATRVPPGYVGIKVDMYGTNKGVQALPIVTGQVWYNPFTEEVHRYPTFMQNVVWTGQEGEGSSENDESMNLSSIEGTTLNCDVGLNYAFIPELVPQVFVQYRQDPEQISANYLRTQVRNVFMQHTTQMKVMDILGPGQSKLFADVLADLNKHLGPKGFRFDMVTFVNRPRPSKDVEEQINAAIAATQRAIKAENQVRQAKAEAEQRAAAAKGFADSIGTVALAQAAANRVLSASITPSLIQYQATQRWDGKLSMYSGGGAVPFINLQR